MSVVDSLEPEATGDFARMEGPFEQPFGTVARFRSFELVAEATTVQRRRVQALAELLPQAPSALHALEPGSHPGEPDLPVRDTEFDPDPRPAAAVERFRVRARR